jgi:hypothetical protein
MEWSGAGALLIGKGEKENDGFLKGFDIDDGAHRGYENKH